MTREKFKRFEADLNATLIERDEESRLMLVALLCNEHVLLVGAPGTAKSMLCDMFGEWLTGGETFRWLLTKYTQPEELFGPYSIGKLTKEDSYERVTRGKLPEAHFAFVDEVFKSSSAILNTLLTLMNERQFHNGTATMDCPLLQMLGASNEWPTQQEELGALFDRFLFRRTVRAVQTDRGLDRLLFSEIEPEVSGHITPAELEASRDEAALVPISSDARDAMRQIIREIRAEGVFPGDRRLRKSIGAAKASAWLDGKREVEPESLEVLQHTLWEDPTEQPRKVAEVVGRIANPVGMKINALLTETEEILAGVDARNLASATSASAKLQDIVKRLDKIDSGNGRVAKARKYVAEEIATIKRRVVESI